MLKFLSIFISFTFKAFRRLIMMIFKSRFLKVGVNVIFDPFD